MPSLVLTVSLNPTATPPVVISSRDVHANGQRIVWQKAPNASPDFTFERLDDLDQENFHQQSIDKGKKKVRCNNRAPNNTPPKKYKYTIVVKSGNNAYTSTIAGNPPGDKPVIRN